ncbi:MAG: cytochrome C [Gammaproteobacteria bacterium]|nr:cytochrome C [Gammaproteobacteria bacterium]
MIRLLLCLMVLHWGAALAIEEHELKDLKLDMSPASLKQGVETVNNVCRGCHDLKFISFASLEGIGLTTQEIDDLRGDAKPADRLMSYVPAEARHATYGVVPPDLSLMARAREGGARYIYTLLTSFHTDAEGKLDNTLFPGVRMPDILGYAGANAEERRAIEDQVTHVAAFLEWASDPNAEKRHHIGWYVLGYLAVLSFLLYKVKKRVWSRLGAMHTSGF